jgi:hypothetical protein
MNYGYIQRIDIQERLSFLQYAMKLGQGDCILGQILVDMDDYAYERFGDEEDQCCPCLFPADEKERYAQRQFLGKIAGFLARYKKGLRVSPLELSNFLEDWIVANIAGTRENLPSAERYLQGGR